MYAAGVSRAFLLANPGHPLTPSQAERYAEMIGRRARSEPMQYITGEQEFFGLRFAVTPDVLIPRPETEHLVEAALERAPKDQAFKIVDVGTGSGAIAVALASHLPLAEITALDISPAALNVARANARGHGLAERVRFLQSDLLDIVRGESFDMVVSNPPYVAESDRDSLEAQVRDYEPGVALFAGTSGLDIYERLIPQAHRVLRPGGWLLLEFGAGQNLQLRQLLDRWNEVGFVPDLQGISRVAFAQRR